MIEESYESVIVSTRIRFARNFKDYPFPARMRSLPHAQEQARELIDLVETGFGSMENFSLYEMASLSDNEAEYLIEHYLISRDLVRHKDIAAVLVSDDESTSIMINEEDHIRAQHIEKKFSLLHAYEHLAGIDEIIDNSVQFAFDREFGYLTACPSNLGTGMRASVMLFLPALGRRGGFRTLFPMLREKGLTVRGVFGEGSATEGDLYQISNEVTLGMSEAEILRLVDEMVRFVADAEITERKRMYVEDALSLSDEIMRSYGALKYCRILEGKELSARMSDIKLGIALGFLSSEGPSVYTKLDDLAVDLRPASITRACGVFTEEERAAYRASTVSEMLRRYGIDTDK